MIIQQNFIVFFETIIADVFKTGLIGPNIEALILAKNYLFYNAAHGKLGVFGKRTVRNKNRMINEWFQVPHEINHVVVNYMIFIVEKCDRKPLGHYCPIPNVPKNSILHL